MSAPEDEFEFFFDKPWSDGLPVVIPTGERIAETLIKFEQDRGHGGYPKPVGARRLTFRIGEPIDMRDYLGQKTKEAVPKVTELLFERLQQSLDEMGPGTHVKDLKR